MALALSWQILGAVHMALPCSRTSTGGVVCQTLHVEIQQHESGIFSRAVEGHQMRTGSPAVMDVVWGCRNRLVIAPAKGVLQALLGCDLL